MGEKDELRPFYPRGVWFIMDSDSTGEVLENVDVQGTENEFTHLVRPPAPPRVPRLVGFS